MSGRTRADAESALENKHELQEALEEDLDDEDAVAKFREHRLRELKASMDNLERMRQQNYGQYSEVTVEKEFLKLTTTAARVVVHFSHKQFRRCEILDAHLKALAPKYFSTRFIKIDVGNAPFFVEKLQIQVLPALFSFFNGVVIDRLIGFEEIGNTDNFKTEVLEKRLLNCGIVEKGAQQQQQQQKQDAKSILNQMDNNYFDGDDFEGLDEA